MHLIYREDVKPYYPQIQELIRRVKSDFVPYDGYYPPSDPSQIDIEFFSNYQLETEHAVVFCDEQALIGLCCLDLDCHREDVPLTEPFSYLSLAMVDPDYRGLGLGNLIQDMIWSLRECGQLHDNIASSTWSGNMVQRHLFEKYGWQVHKRIQNHRANGDDTLYYRLSPSTEEPDVVTKYNGQQMTSSRRFEFNI